MIMFSCLLLGNLPSTNIIFACPYWRAWTVKDIEIGSESNDLSHNPLVLSCMGRRRGKRGIQARLPIWGRKANMATELALTLLVQCLSVNITCRHYLTSKIIRITR